MISTHYLHSLFAPKSIAVFGVSSKPDAVASVVFRNIQQAGFRGELFPVNPKHASYLNLRCYSSATSIPTSVELAVIATPAHTVPSILQDCGEKGIRNAIILTAGFAEAGVEGLRLEQDVVEIALRYHIRFIGPNCLGVICPSHGVNATFANGEVSAGKIALISQSGAICTAILDWAANRDIGFSNVVSLGSSTDIDFGEILDYLVADNKTSSILMYVEGIRDARAFMSGLRAAARVKPVVVLKAGRHQTGIKAAVSHTGALVGDDDVFDAALRRAGVVRGMDIGDLFSAATVLSTGMRTRGDSLSIITNGGGPAVMACDKASDLNIPLANISDGTKKQLDQILPGMWSHNNPVDILGDADASRYERACQILLDDPDTDGVLVLLTPQAMTNPTDIAKSIVKIKQNHHKPVLTCWMGEKQVDAARKIFLKEGVPTFRLPENAVKGYSFLTSFLRNQKLLLQVPGPLSDDKDPDTDGARLIIENALSEKRSVLTESESKAILSAFQIPVAKTMIARDANEAIVAAETIGFPVVMKINSKKITHKSDVGGVKLNVANAVAVQATFKDMMSATSYATTDVDGVVIEPMVSTTHARELLVGVIRDKVFGPVISFGGGGTLVEMLGDKAVALPPLNRMLAKELISRTHVAKILGEFRHMPPVNMAALENVLLRISEMVCELPEICELDINPLVAHPEGVVAVDARIVVDRFNKNLRRYEHTAIHPYPNHLITNTVLSGGDVCVIRPIRPEDAGIEKAFVDRLSNESKQMRFMNTFRHISPEMLARFTQIDYHREMAFIAVVRIDGQDLEIGVARYVVNIDGESCEFAIVVDDQWSRKRLAHKLMGCLEDAARARGLLRIEGDVLAGNMKMQGLAKDLGFTVEHSAEDESLRRLVKNLQ